MAEARASATASPVAAVALVLVAATGCAPEIPNSPPAAATAVSRSAPGEGVSASVPIESVVAAAGTTTQVPVTAAEHEYGGNSSTSRRFDEYPYVRYDLALADAPGPVDISWHGRSVNLNDLALYTRHGDNDPWAGPLDVSAPAEPGGPITLSGTVATDGEALQVLVIDEPRAHDVFASEPDRAFADPGTYDAALLHMTDTQYLAQRAPELFTGMTRWTADNAADRKIDYVMHTGDLIQSWIRLNGTDDAARREFALAHDAMSTLTNAGVPFGVLPGNHDNKWNVAGRLVPGMHDENNALFNEYFGPHEFDSRPWWGGSVAPDDNFAHFDLVELADAEFLMLSIGFNPPEHVLRWAEDVLDRYPDRNVVIGAHYYLDDDGRLRMSGFGDTGSAGQQIWNRLVVPYESVVMVLSGHVDGQTTVTDRPIPGTDRRVVEMLADYQGFLVDGERRADFQRLLQFDLDGGRVAVDTHSPALDSFAVEDYDPQRRYGADDGEFVAPVQLRGDLPRAVMAGS